MFDDQPIKGNSNIIPPNLPVSEASDMFADVENEAPAQAARTVASGGFDSALSAGVLKAKQQMENSTAVSPAETEPKYIVPPQTQEIYNIKEPTLTRNLLITIGVLIIVVAVGAGGWWAYGYFTKLKAEPVEDTATIPAEPAAAENFILTETVDQDVNMDIIEDVKDEQVLFGEPIDKDGDGLDDSRETELATDPNNWDTDSDGLSDGDEVLIWKTDPLQSDTDGDGYQDGQEVKNGYNPAGTGKIFEPPKQ